MRTKALSLFFSIMLFCALLVPSICQARSSAEITDWYVKNYESEIVVNPDSTLHITEKITADCGNLPDKHGIFRSLPTYYHRSTDQKVKTPVFLQSITDFNDNTVQYSTEHDYSNDIVTWKIGDPNRTVTGENYYKIVYDVRNTIRFDDPNFDEFYWNLLGAFWKIDIDAATITVRFPEGVTQANSSLNLYTGAIGKKGQDATATWVDDTTLRIAATRSLKAGEGITASLTFPKNIVHPYEPSWIERNSGYLWLLLPIISFLLCYALWKKHGADPKLSKTTIAEYEPPEKIPPMELGMIQRNRRFSNNLISAAIINLAVKGAIKIEEIEKEGIFGKQDHKLILLDGGSKNISSSEKVLLEKLFKTEYQTSDEASEGKPVILLSKLRNKFYTDIPAITKAAEKHIGEIGAFTQSGFTWQIALLVIAIVITALFFFLAIGYISSPYGSQPVIVFGSVIITSIVMFIFAALMPKATPKGAEIQWKARGFKLYMETAEKYREQFNEKENIFERYLPYAMVFGIVGLWIQKMKEIYGEEYFNAYHPVWYTGHFASFNVDSLTDSINALSHEMASTLASNPSSSGSGGGGFSGGGGGGGGGGGW